MWSTPNVTRSSQEKNGTAKIRILEEQVIRQLKIFKILGNEVPISVIPQLVDIAIVCPALANLRKQIHC